MKMGPRCLEGYWRFVPDIEPEGGSKGTRRMERSSPENRLKCHRRINIILLIQGLMKYNKQIWQKLNNPEWSTSHDSCVWATKMWKMRPSYNIYSLLNITSCTHHEQTIRIHAGDLLCQTVYFRTMYQYVPAITFARKVASSTRKSLVTFLSSATNNWEKFNDSSQSPRKSIRKCCQWTPLIYRST
jgi:hypothetical protein